MRDPERVPKHNVFVRDVNGWIRSNPFREALGWFPGGLWNVAAGGVELVVFVC
jgi:hypothetical protein